MSQYREHIESPKVLGYRPPPENDEDDHLPPDSRRIWYAIHEPDRLARCIAREERDREAWRLERDRSAARARAYWEMAPPIVAFLIWLGCAAFVVALLIDIVRRGG